MTSDSQVALEATLQDRKLIVRMVIPDEYGYDFDNTEMVYKKVELQFCTGDVIKILFIL